jgi:hypothetical protein
MAAMMEGVSMEIAGAEGSSANHRYRAHVAIFAQIVSCLRSGLHALYFSNAEAGETACGRRALPAYRFDPASDMRSNPRKTIFLQPQLNHGWQCGVD